MEDREFNIEELKKLVRDAKTQEIEKFKKHIAYCDDCTNIRVGNLFKKINDIKADARAEKRRQLKTLKKMEESLDEDISNDPSAYGYYVAGIINDSYGMPARFSCKDLESAKNMADALLKNTNKFDRIEVCIEYKFGPINHFVVNVYERDKEE